MKRLVTFTYLLLSMLFADIAQAESASEIRIGSKKFTESVILSELITQHLQNNNVSASHKDQLGGTRLLWNALVQGELDIYPDYTGTIIYEILQGNEISSDADIKAALAQYGVSMTDPLGFNNTYALGVTPPTARKFSLEKISDLEQHPKLKFGFTNEFMDREDGWPGLRNHYQLPQTEVRGLDHDLAYKGLEAGSIDLIDLYSTDAEIAYYQLSVLEDDKSYFPDYRAVILYRTDLLDRSPGVQNYLAQLSGSISETEMIQMNSAVKLDGHSEAEVAQSFLNIKFNTLSKIKVSTRLDRLIATTSEHLFLVCISLGAAILVAIPLGIWGARNETLGQIILSIVGIIQTIPSLALLVFMIPLLGIGGPPALVALFLYSLLPIVRNTLSGLTGLPLAVQESARALGLPPAAQLRLIELPLAARSILAGIKISAVINVGTATLGALIGAGGYGQPILTGIRLDDTSLILEGAIPAAVLALLVQWSFDFAERTLLSPGLQRKQDSVS
ncbi:MAG: ABC transporter permease subunit [Candidatus Marinimicrobia bacterium]|nr:ABC transporter permease subunit [Candidatus Neomarinimicrobiota bacterium]